MTLFSWLLGGMTAQMLGLILLDGEPSQLFDVASTNDLIRWVIRVGVMALFANAWRVERWQHRQDLALKDLQLDIANNRPHNDDFKDLQKSVLNVDRLVRRIAAKQGVSTRDED